MTTRRKLLLWTVTFLALYGTAGAQSRGGAAGSSGPVGRSICDTCACSPDNVRPVTVNCTCAKTKLLIVRDQDTTVLSSVQDLTLASCGFVSLPPSGLSSSTALARVTVRDMKLFHYTAGLFPALESLSVENVDELVLDGFGPASRTLRHLTLRRTAVVKLVKGTVTTAAPLRRVLFDRVDVDEIESGALEMSFVGDGDNGQLAAADGFTVVNSTIKYVHSGGVTVRSGAVRILNSTLDNLASGAVVVDDARRGVRLSHNRLGSMAGDSVSAVQWDGDSAVYVGGNEFRTLPADMQLLRSERPAEFVGNNVESVDLGPFLFGLGPAVRAADNLFTCDCDPRRISVLKLNQVFPGLLQPDVDSRFASLLADNYCRQPANTTLAGYRDLLVREIVCEGANVTAIQPPQSPTGQPQPSRDTAAPNHGNAITAAAYVSAAVVATSFLLRVC
ncbi:uncharacterized protein LOC132932124 [Rhopalosiphum padi]|uniref:uncharacterized protein LOC132932124 n=1 Tax=Rhopalosiphum padi TaxID=40932 RepID=UPI00298E1F88|nr:uncharacterized protein LOC132932124 [Rhopalosiphum padi]